jgi:hypothetical protein
LAFFFSKVSVQYRSSERGFGFFLYPFTRWSVILASWHTRIGCPNSSLVME